MEKLISDILDNALIKIKKISGVDENIARRVIKEYYVCKGFIDQVEDPDFASNLSASYEYLLRYFDAEDDTFQLDVKKSLLIAAANDDKKAMHAILCGNIFDNNMNYYAQIKAKSEIVGQKMESNTDIPCPKCNKKTIFTYHKQGRSADEPMDQHFECLSCGHKWKIRG